MCDRSSFYNAGEKPVDRQMERWSKGSEKVEVELWGKWMPSSLESRLEGGNLVK